MVDKGCRVLACYGYMVTPYGNAAWKGIIFVLIIMSDGAVKKRN